MTGDRVHVAYICAAMRVVAEVDVELGLSRVAWIGAAQDVGKAINPQAVHGQIEGGTAQGLGLALMEEIQTRDGLITNASFTDYLIPTTLDMPVIDAELVEDPEPDAPYGAKGVGEPPRSSRRPRSVRRYQRRAGASSAACPSARTTSPALALPRSWPPPARSRPTTRISSAPATTRSC